MVDTAAQQTPEMLKKLAPSGLKSGGGPSRDTRKDVPGSFPGEERQDDQSEAQNPGQGSSGRVDDSGNVVDNEGNVIGRVAGDTANLVGSSVDAEGNVLGQNGSILEKADIGGEAVQENGSVADTVDGGKRSVQGAFNVNEKGEVIDDNDAVVGKVLDGDLKELADRSVKEIDREGNLKGGDGSIIGKADMRSDVLKTGDQKDVIDTSILEGNKVNKAGNVVDKNGMLVGSVETGNVKNLIGKTVDADGNIWNESGKTIGTAKALPEDERISSEAAPFEDFPDATVDNNGNVVFEGQVVGRVIEGDVKTLARKKVDQDGEIVDRAGNVLGKAERWEEEEPEPEAVDLSALAGKRVNKIGNLVDPSGAIYGRLTEGDPKKLAGKMCDKNGNIWNEGGEIVGKAELTSESEREGQKEGPFAGFEGLTLDKTGKVVDAKGTVVGRLVEGDAKSLYGKAIDEDGDILDKNGNSLGKVERWEEEEKKKANPLAGHKVNQEGNVFDEDGNVIGKLTEGTASKCAGMEIDEDGDIVNSKGQTIGHAVLLENLPPEEEPAESEEEAQKRKQLEQDRKLAGQMATCIQQSVDKIQPILRMITDATEEAERQPEEELDEQKLVDTVKPLLEEGGKVLQEANGVIRGLDPDGRIAANAKQRAASREATPEEYHLAELLKELSENVSQTIENAKKKIAGMPHAKKELNPLWGLLAEPLGQIIAAVGLLLSGVLGIVGRLLGGLGLGGLLDGLLGGLGIKGILDNLGLGTLSDSLTGKK